MTDSSRTVVLFLRVRDSHGTHRLPEKHKMVLPREKYTSSKYYEKVMAKAKEMYPGYELEPIIYNPPEVRGLLGWATYIRDYCTSEDSQDED